jgi:hypothetical protein
MLHRGPMRHPAVMPQPTRRGRQPEHRATLPSVELRHQQQPPTRPRRQTPANPTIRDPNSSPTTTHPAGPSRPHSTQREQKVPLQKGNPSSHDNETSRAHRQTRTKIDQSRTRH